jgi:hypothetical protein
MNVRTPQRVIDEIHRLLRTTDYSRCEIARLIGYSEFTVEKYELGVEPEFRRRRRVTIAPVPVGKPVCHVERWIAEGFDPVVARFMASNRTRLLRVSEGV